MSGFLEYLDTYEKKFEKKVVVEQPVKVIQKQIVKENVVVQKTVPKKIIKIVKKVVSKKPVSEHINYATQLLDGIEEDVGYNPMAPSSTRFYDNTGLSSKQNINIKENKNITSRANDLLSEDNSSGGMPQPLMDVPKMDEEMLKYVPKEMLTEEQKQQMNMNQPKVDNKQNIEVPPEIQKMMEETRRMQGMFTNVDMSSIPPEFLNQ